MARNSTLHIDIPQATLRPHALNKNANNANGTLTPESPGYFQSKEESSFSFTRNGSQYLASPSSATSCSPMMTPLPFKMQTQQFPMTPHPGKDEKKRLNEYEFPISTGPVKVGTPFQSHLNHPFTQLRQQRLQEHQQQQQPAESKSSSQAYINKYASYTNSSQAIVRSQSLSGLKPSTTTALSMIEKEKLTFQCASSGSNRDSLVSPPPPYLSSDHGVDSFDKSPLFAAGPVITPASLKLSKRNSLPPNLSSVRNARELKRHSLSMASPQGTAQWPSAMTMTVAAVTRPKLARTMSPQAISIHYNNSISGGGELKSPLAITTPTAVFTPRTTRLMEKSETETLYSYKISDDEHSSPVSATRVNPRAVHSGQAMPSSASPPSGDGRRFPGFWEDAIDTRLHWKLFGAIAFSCGVWVAAMPPLFILAATVSGLVVLAIATQYTVYLWRRSRYNKQPLQERSSSAGASSSIEPTASVPLANSYQQLSEHHKSHSHSASNSSSMHTSARSIGSDSFLEPHQPSPPRALKDQFQHQYFGNSSSATSSPPQFPAGYQLQQEQYPPQSSFSSTRSDTMSPSPDFQQSWHTHYGQQGSAEKYLDNRSRQIKRQESSSSIASSETVSSSSTSSELNSSESASPSRPMMHHHGDHYVTSMPPKSLADSGLGSSSSMSSLSSLLPPPPAYVSRKCEDGGAAMLSEKSVATLGMSLPEIAPLGDLLSEFAVDFGSFQL